MSGAPGPLAGVRVLELGGEQADYAGLLCAGLGASVVKVEPPEGSPGRRIGPFYAGAEDPERSLYFWGYNRGKRSVVLDLADPDGRRAPRRPARRRGRADRRHAGRRADRARPRPGRAPGARARAADAVRRGRPVGGVRHLRPRLARPRRGGDELRLRPGPGRALRPAADRAAGLALLPHRRRAARDRDRQRPALPAAQRPRPEGVGGGPRGGRQEHRDRPDELGHAAPAGVPADLQARARHDHQPVDQLHQGRPVEPVDARRRAGPPLPAAVHGALRPGRRRCRGRRRRAARPACGPSPGPPRPRPRGSSTCSGSPAGSPTRTCPGRRRSSRACCGPPSASRTRTRPTSTGCPAARSRTSSTPSWSRRSATR